MKRVCSIEVVRKAVGKKIGFPYRRSFFDHSVCKGDGGGNPGGIFIYIKMYGDDTTAGRFLGSSNRGEPNDR